MPARDPRELFSLHETMRTLRPERKSRGRIIALWLLALGLAASISFALISGALPTEMRLASMRENMAVAAASVPSLMDGAISSLYRALCPYVTDCEVAQTAQVVAPPQERVRPLAQQPTPLATDKRKEATVSTPPTSSPQTTVVKQYITQPVIERIIQSPPFPSGRVLGASTDDTAAKLSDLQNQINALANLPRSVFVPSFSGPAATTPVSTATFAQSQRIDNLSGTSLSNITVNGVSGLTDADIPDSLTASNYLPLSGGTLAGDLTLTGNFTVSGAQTLSGAITIPHLTATSTTQASSFQQFTATHGTTTSLFVNSLLSSPNATIGALTATSTLAVSGTLSLPAIPWGLLSTDATGQVVATSSPTAAYFVATSSSVASLFNGGLLSLASSTIGSGTQAGGLTIFGGATTTGNATFSDTSRLIFGTTRFLHKTGTGNVFLGEDAGNLTLTGNANVAIGYHAGRALTLPNLGANPQANVLLGYEAGTALTSGRETVAIGYRALASFVSDDTGDGVHDSINTVVGSLAAENLTSGQSNVFLGQKAGEAVTTAQSSIFIGSHSGTSWSPGTNNISELCT